MYTQKSNNSVFHKSKQLIFLKKIFFNSLKTDIIIYLFAIFAIHYLKKKEF